MSEIKSRVLKLQNVEWKKLIQTQGDLKKISKDEMDKLKASIKNNDLIQPFYVWQKDDELYLLDGTHRQKAFNELESEGIEVPKKVPAIFIEAKSLKAASKLILIYSSIYANVTKDGFNEFINEFGQFDYNQLKTELNIPELNLENFLSEYIDSVESNSIINEKGLQGKLDSKHLCPSCGYEF
jgi:hypothetical protein